MSTTDRYGCHDRAPFIATMTAQDGWVDDFRTRTPHMVESPIRSEPECQFTLSALGRNDARCSGCSHQTEGSSS